MKKISYIIPIMVLAICLFASFIHAVSFPVHGSNILNYNYSVPASGIGTPIMHKTDTDQQEINNKSTSYDFNIRLRQKTDSTEYSRSKLLYSSASSTSLIFTLANAGLTSPGYTNPSDAQAQNYLMMCSPNYFYIQNYPLNASSSARISYTWYL